MDYLDFRALTGLLAVIFVIGVPSLALATHLVLRPLVKEIAGAIRGTQAGGGSELEVRLSRMEDSLERLERRVGSLADAQRFKRELMSEEGE